MISWRRPSKRSSSVALPSGPSNTYSLSTSSHGIRRRCAARASRARITSFSLTSISCRAAFHSCADTIGGVFILSPFDFRYLTQRVGAPSLESRPLGDRTSVGAHSIAVVANRAYRPTVGRVLPLLLASVHGEVHECEAVLHRLYAAVVRPISLEDSVAVPYVADEVHQADLAPFEQRVEGAVCRVPRHVPAHEVAVACAFVIGALAEDRICDVAGMQIGQLGDLGGDPGAAFALLGRGMTGVPHEVIGDQLAAPLECVEQRDGTVGINERRCRVYFDHRQPTAARGDRVSFARVRLFANPQLIQFALEGGPVDHRGQSTHDCSRAVLRFESFQGQPPEMSPITVLPGSKSPWTTVSLT